MKQESKRAALLTGEPEPPRKPSRLKKVALRVVTAVLAAGGSFAGLAAFAGLFFRLFRGGAGRRDLCVAFPGAAG